MATSTSTIIETAAQARVAVVEADAKSAHAAGLQHLAEQRRDDAATERGEVNDQFQQADTLDPDTREGGSPREGSATSQDGLTNRRTA